VSGPFGRSDPITSAPDPIATRSAIESSQTSSAHCWHHRPIADIISSDWADLEPTEMTLTSSEPKLKLVELKAYAINSDMSRIVPASQSWFRANFRPVRSPIRVLSKALGS